MAGETPAKEVLPAAAVAAAAVALPPADLQEDSVRVIEEHASDDQTPSPPADEGDSYHEDDRPNDGRDQVVVDEPGNLADLKQRIIRQVEYYFSDENLPTDNHLLGLIKKNKGGFEWTLRSDVLQRVEEDLRLERASPQKLIKIDEALIVVPIRAIASFRKMKKLSDDQEFIATALKESSFITVSPDGKKLKRTHPLPCDVRDEKLFTVLVENLPEDRSLANLERMFGEVGKINKICIHDPNSAEVSKKAGKIDKFLINKLHALVEYETVEAAEKAVGTLHNDEDWRNGMRVKLLKCTVKSGQKKAWKALDSANNGAGHPSDLATNDQVFDSSQHDDRAAVEEVGDHIPKEKNEEGGRNHVRPRRHKHRGGMNGCGHGTTPSSHGVDVSKPPPGPRMPDGTRGFTIGRGRPPALDHI